MRLLNNSPYFVFSIESHSRYKDEVIRSDQDVRNHKEKIEERVARVKINDLNILVLKLIYGLFKFFIRVNPKKCVVDLSLKRQEIILQSLRNLTK